MDPVGDHPDEMWDEEDGFFYDVLRLPDGTGQRLKVRSLVGLLPLCATTVIEPERARAVPARCGPRVDELPRAATATCSPASPTRSCPGVNGRHILSLVNEDKLRRILARMLDEERFLGPHGIRSLSTWHLEHPYEFDVDGTEYRVQYEPAESTTGMFGGNSNWRGPVWFPVNVLIIRALLQHYQYYGDDFTIECPTGSGNQMTLFEVAKEIVRPPRRAPSSPTRTDGGRSTAAPRSSRTDPHWRDLVLFYEYFHGDNGAGLGASHQTGWTGVVARLIQLFGELDAEATLRIGGRPLARPFRRLTDDKIGDATTARRTRGVRP